MFERYTEKARRIIFFARYEASQFGQPYIETEHILLGLLREDKALTNRFLRSHASVESIRKQVEKHTAIREKISTSVDLPLSNECKRVLAYAAEEAERLGHKHIGTEHLFLGLLREQGCFAQQLLAELGIDLAKAREGISKAPSEQSGRTESAFLEQTLGELCLDLTQKATEGELEPVVGRDLEVQAVIEVLCRKERRNPMLLGGRGVGKRAIVHALAQRIAGGNVPRVLADMHVLSLSPEALGAWCRSREKFDELAKVLGAAAASEKLIVFVDALRGTPDPGRRVAGRELTGVMRFVLQETNTLCIAATSEEEYKAACTDYPRMDKLFRPLHVKPLDGEQALAALRARKEKLEQFHEVAFGEDALECAVRSADSYLKERLLPGKALELLDAAAAAVKVRAEEDGSIPKELKACRATLKAIGVRMNDAIGNHEFEKAKFYSEEERNQRNKLAELEIKHGVESNVAPAVSRTDVEQVIAKWNAYPYADR